MPDMTSQELAKLLHRTAAKVQNAPQAARRTKVEVPGRIHAVLSTTAAQAFLDGSDKSVRVRVPMQPDPLAAGDYVTVDKWSDGTLEVSRIIGRDRTSSDHPDLEDHDDMGLVTDTAFEAHAVESTHLLPYVTPNTLATDDGKWSLIAFGTIDQRYGQVAFEVMLGGNGSNAMAWTRGTLRGRVRQQLAFGNAPMVELELVDGGDLDSADVSIVVTSDAGPTTYELHVRVTREYEWLEFVPLWLSNQRASHSWIGCSAFEAALPAGDATAGISGAGHRYPNVRDYGAVGDGTTDDTVAITAADAVIAPKAVPYGDYLTTLAATALDGPYKGPGQIIDSGPNKRAPYFSAVKAAPSPQNFSAGSVVTAFNGDLSKVQLAIEHRVTGATTLGQPAATYLETPEAAPILIWLYNDSGWNESTSAGGPGRTGVNAIYANVTHAGLGDAGPYNGKTYVTGQKPSYTSWLANAAGTIYTGQVTAGADAVHLNTMELNSVGGAFDVASNAFVLNFYRDVSTGAAGTAWSGVRMQNQGSEPIDVGLMLYNGGSGSGFRVGVDISNADLPTTGTWLRAAITLSAQQRIYFNASGTDSAGGNTFYRRPDSTGLVYLMFNSPNLSLGGANMRLDAGFGYRIDNVQVVGARSTGWTPMTGTGNIAATYDTAAVTLPQLAGRVLSIQAVLATHGLAGA